jgi:hypothetical protein
MKMKSRQIILHSRQIGRALYVVRLHTLGDWLPTLPKLIKIYSSTYYLVGATTAPTNTNALTNAPTDALINALINTPINALTDVPINAKELVVRNTFQYLIPKHLQ